MSIWLIEIKNLEQINASLQGQLPLLEKELAKLVKTDDENMLLVYARRCLEVIVTYLCEHDLGRSRGSEPLKRILDKLGKEEKVPHNIIVSMQSLNSMSTFGAHPKEYDLKQVKPVLSNLEAILDWYIGYRQILLKEVVSKAFTKQESSIKRTKKRSSSVWMYAIFAIAIIGTILVLSQMGVIGLSGKNSAVSVGSLAILPFDNMTNDTEQEFWAVGMHDGLISEISKLSELNVISKTTMLTYKGISRTMHEIATELNVDAILETSVEETGDNLKIQLKMFKADDNEEMLWSKPYTVRKEEINNLYKEITKNIAGEINLSLTPREKRALSEARPIDPRVTEAYYKGKYSLGLLSVEGMKAGLNYFEQAIKLDPDYAQAHAALGGAYAYMKQMDIVSSADADPIIAKHLGRAFELDTTIAEIFYWQAIKNVWTDYNWTEGEKSFLRAIELNPSFSEARALFSHYLMIRGRWEESRIQMNTALELDPSNPFVNVLNGIVLMNEERYDELIALYEPFQRVMPDNPLVALGLLVSFATSEQYDKAKEQAKVWIGRVGFEEANALLESVYEKDGFHAALTAAADKVTEMMDTKFVSAQKLFVLYALAGNKEKTLNWIERGFINKDPDIPYIGCVSYLKPYRQESRLKDLVRRINLN